MNIEHGDVVSSPRFPGVALWYVEPGKVRSQSWGDHGAEYGEWEEDGSAVVVMVGDDREHRVPFDDLEKIEEAEFCGGCGQIGCVANG